VIKIGQRGWPIFYEEIEVEIKDEEHPLIFFKIIFPSIFGG
jgi:hypothetical protein